jgi:3alpha(or 20beta)-hydroxysteroid dehydrogenase
MAGRLSGKVAIVTGGTRGMGEAIVRGIVAESGKVVFGGRDEAAGNAIASDLGNGAYFVRQDVALEEDWRKIVASDASMAW